MQPGSTEHRSRGLQGGGRSRGRPEATPSQTRAGGGNGWQQPAHDAPTLCGLQAETRSWELFVVGCSRKRQVCDVSSGREAGRAGGREHDARNQTLAACRWAGNWEQLGGASSRELRADGSSRPTTPVINPFGVAAAAYPEFFFLAWSWGVPIVRACHWSFCFARTRALLVPAAQDLPGWQKGAEGTVTIRNDFLAGTPKRLERQTRPPSKG